MPPGFACPDCGAIFDGAEGDSEGAVRTAAGIAGWVLGHWDGEAHYACPDCAHGLYDPVTLDLIEAALGRAPAPEKVRATGMAVFGPQYVWGFVVLNEGLRQLLGICHRPEAEVRFCLISTGCIDAPFL